MTETSAHLTEIQIAGYLGRTLGPAEHGSVETHLADCGACRSELVQVRRLLESAPRPRSRSASAAAVAAAVAAIALVVLRPFDLPQSEPETLRRPEQTGEPGLIEVVMPVPEVQVPVDAVTFIWRAGGTDGGYAFELVSENGAPVHVAMTTDTVLVLPQNIVLDPGKAYFWHVDALHADGHALTTRVQRLVTR